MRSFLNRSITLSAFVLTIFVLASPLGLAASAPPYPADMPLLTIHPAEGDQAHRVTLEELLALPTRSVTGFIPDVGDVSAEWSGVSLATLLTALGEPPPQRLTAKALDNYHEIIPHDDLGNFDPIVAYQRNGKYLGINERGPLVVMYPIDELPAGKERLYYNRMVWQLNEIHLE